MASRIGVLTNPNSKKNKRRPGRVRELEKAVGGAGVVRQTASVDDIPEVLREFLDAGCEYWVSDGGDGALHWMLAHGDRLLRSRGASWPIVVPTNGGTIDFVAKKAGIRGGAEQILAKIRSSLEVGRSPRTVVLDTHRIVGDVIGEEEPGGFERLGFATAVGGIAQRFFALYYENEEPGPATIVELLWHAVAGLAGNSLPEGMGNVVSDRARVRSRELFTPLEAEVEYDGKVLAQKSFTSLEVGSIDINLGNVVRTFGLAAAGDQLHLQAISITPTEIALNMPNIIAGTPIVGKNLYDGPAQKVRVTARNGQVIDPVVDGEMFHGLSEVRIELGPKMTLPVV